MMQHEEPANDSLAELHWMVGDWIGEGLGGRVEERILPPAGGAMPAVFRLVHGDKVVFYEFFLIEATGPADNGGSVADNSGGEAETGAVDPSGGVQLLIHHFNPGMQRWEDQPVAFDLTEVSTGASASADGPSALFVQRNDPESQTHLRYFVDGEGRLGVELSKIREGIRQTTATFAFRRQDSGDAAGGPGEGNP